jgi:tRNA uridine 5-carboxymethylaminomethyl modification enzyme
MLDGVSAETGLQAEVEIKYAGYITRQHEAIRRSKNFESVRVPEDIDYATVTGLSREAREKLTRIRPRSLGQASRIAGITPAAISLLSIYLRKKKMAS